MALEFIGDIRFWQGECEASIAYYRRAEDHATRAGARRYEVAARHSICLALTQGLTPADDVIAELESMLREHTGDRVFLFKTQRFLAMMHAFGGRFDRARVYAGHAIETARELGMDVDLAGGSLRDAATVATLEGDLDLAERYLREAVEILQRIGDRGHLDSVAPALALVLLHASGREPEALEIAGLADGVLENDVDAQVLMRSAKAIALSRLGQMEEAMAFAQDAVARAWSTEYALLRAQSQEALAEVLRRAGRAAEAAEALERAIGVHVAKGNIVSAEGDRRALAALRASADVPE